MAGFPKYNDSSKKGDDGLTILSWIVKRDLGWIVRPNHNETDFGIDVYLDIVMEHRQVSGKTVACQVKTGDSYFSEKNNLGWVYRDELSHLNYFLNHDIPVVIILVDDNTYKAYWTYCDPLKTERTGKQWKITIPFDQGLKADSKKELLQYVNPVKDYVSQLNNFWEENQRFKEYEKIYFVIDKEDIQNESYENLIMALERIQANPDLVTSLRGKVEILIHGYNDDERELAEIPEVKAWVQKIFNDTIGLSYFVPKNVPEGFFLVLAMSFMNYEEVPDSDVIEEGRRRYQIKLDLSDHTFLKLAFNDLNEFTARHKLPESVNQEVSFEIGEMITGYKGENSA